MDVLRCQEDMKALAEQKMWVVGNSFLGGHSGLPLELRLAPCHVFCLRWFEGSGFGGGGDDFALGYFLPMHVSALADSGKEAATVCITVSLTWHMCIQLNCMELQCWSVRNGQIQPFLMVQTNSLTSRQSPSVFYSKYCSLTDSGWVRGDRSGWQGFSSGG